MLFQTEFTLLFITVIISIITFGIGVYVTRWFARKKRKPFKEKIWDTTLKTAFSVNLGWLLIDISINITSTFFLLDYLILNLISRVFSLFIGTIIVMIVYKKQILESFQFVIVIQLIFFVLVFFFGLLILSNIGLFILEVGLGYTLLLTVFGLLLGFVLGISLALMRVYGGIELGWFASGYEKLFRGIPVMVLILIFWLGMPGLFWYLTDSTQRAVGSVILALGLRSGAYQSQIFRGAILSVDLGQMEAARALGMNRLKAFQHVVLPQALRLAMPGWSNEYSVVIKDSSFAYLVGIFEMTKAAYHYSVNFPELLALSMGVLAILYFLLTYPVTTLFGERLSKKLKELGMGGG